MTLLFAFLFMLLVVAAMSIGVMMGRKPISGSCGGISALGLGECEICGGNPAACDSRKGPARLSARQVEAASLAVDAAQPRSQRDDVRTL